MVHNISTHNYQMVVAISFTLCIQSKRRCIVFCGWVFPTCKFGWYLTEVNTSHSSIGNLCCCNYVRPILHFLKSEVSELAGGRMIVQSVGVKRWQVI